MRKHTLYYLTFSTQRFVSLLKQAGFDIEPPAEAVGSLVRFVSDTAERTIILEYAEGDEWKPLATTEPRMKEVVGPGQYL